MFMMIAGRAMLCTTLKRHVYHQIQPYLLADKQSQTVMVLTRRLISTHQVTKSIKLISQDDKIKLAGFKIENPIGNRPLLLMFSWLSAKEKHLMKFTELYLEQGFDIAIIKLNAWQFLQPAKGSQIVAADLLKFMLANESYKKIVLHGFSVGGYMWGEVMAIIDSDLQKYSSVIDKVICQTWDSAADVTEISIGVPRALFPHNSTLQIILQKYMEFHMSLFYNMSTKHYLKASQYFHKNMVRTPALFLLSKRDPVGSIPSNMKVRDSWVSLGTKTYVKIFEKSPHVGHFRKYPKEYVMELYKFLSMFDLIKNEEKMKARF